jgi:UPF0716 family protein affecting phage T7 exclusion
MRVQAMHVHGALWQVLAAILLLTPGLQSR